MQVYSLTAERKQLPVLPLQYFRQRQHHQQQRQV